MSADAKHKKEMVAIHKLWKASEREADDLRRQLASADGGARSASESKLRTELEQAKVWCVELKDKVKFTEKQLRESRAESDSRGRQLEDIKYETDRLSSDLQKQQGLTEQYATRAKELDERCRTIARDAEELKNLSLADLREREEKVQASEQVASALRERVQELQMECQYKDKVKDADASKIATLEQHLDLQNQIQQDLSRQLAGAKEDIRSLQMSKTAEVENAAAATMQALRADNKRLVRMLSYVDEYKEFVANYNEGDGMHFVGVPPPPAAAASASVGARSFMSSTANVSGDQDWPVVPARELEIWFPAQIFKLFNRFAQQNLGGMSSLPHHAVGQLLLDMNTMWRKRESVRLGKVKAACVRKVKEMQTGVSSKSGALGGLPLNDTNVAVTRMLNASKEISKVLKDLQGLDTPAETDGSVDVAGRRVRKMQHLTDEKLLEATLTAVENLSRQVADYADENSHLREKLSQFNPLDKAGPPAGSSTQYMDGAVWMGSSAQEILLQYCDKISALNTEFQQKGLELSQSSDPNGAAAGMMNQHPDGDFYLRSLCLQSGYLESLDRVMFGLKDAVKSNVESVKEQRGVVFHEPADAAGSSQHMNAMHLAASAGPTVVDSNHPTAGPGAHGSSLLRELEASHLAASSVAGASHFFDDYAL